MAVASSKTELEPTGVRRPRWHPLEIAFWAVGVAGILLFGDRRFFLSQIFVYALFALSLDLILGYAGILSLGHAAFFGVGSYTAGLLAQHGWTDPLSALAAAGIVAGGFGFAVGALVVSGTDLTRLMLTLGIGLLTLEGANQASSITGGVDGLSDMLPTPLFGTFSFGLDGTTACLYSFVVVALIFVLTRRLVHSPFGLSLRGIRENARRMPAIGADVHQRLRAVFAISAAMAGIAGALLAQTTSFVGIDTLSFQRSAEVLIILAFGGTGHLYGALMGAALFTVAQDWLSGISPAYWQFWLGALLMSLVLLAPGGLMGGLDLLRQRLGRKARAWPAR